MRLLLILAVFLGTQSFGADFPLLQKTVGGMDKEDGVVVTKSCQIFDDHSGMSADEVIELILQAEKDPVSVVGDIVPQVPSVEIFANYPERYAVDGSVTGLRAVKVPLWLESSYREWRNGWASAQLMTLVNSVCKDF